MTWKNRKRKKKVTKYESYSIINKFKTEKKITNSTLNDINNISLEDLVAIKLELSTRYLCGKFYGMPLWRITRHTVTDALLKTALSIARTKKEAARFLGIDYMELNRYIKKYDIIPFFERGGETVSTEKE
jgi:DNA-binding protein Fis